MNPPLDEKKSQLNKIFLLSSKVPCTLIEISPKKRNIVSVLSHDFNTLLANFVYASLSLLNLENSSKPTLRTSKSTKNSKNVLCQFIYFFSPFCHSLALKLLHMARMCSYIHSHTTNSPFQIIQRPKSSIIQEDYINNITLK